MADSETADRLLIAEVRKRLKNKGLHNDQHLAKAGGVSRPTAWRWRTALEKGEGIALEPDSREALLQWLEDHPPTGMSGFQRGYGKAVDEFGAKLLKMGWEPPISVGEDEHPGKAGRQQAEKVLADKEEEKAVRKKASGGKGSRRKGGVGG